MENMSSSSSTVHAGAIIETTSVANFMIGLGEWRHHEVVVVEKAYLILIGQTAAVAAADYYHYYSIW